jgi:hypothetical protein
MNAPHRVTAVRVLERGERDANCDQLFGVGHVGSESHDRVKTGKAQNQQMFSGVPRKANISESGRLIARCADLLSNYLSQRFIDPVLPARPGVLKVIKNVPVNSQRDKLLGIRDGWTLGREFRGLRGCHFKRRFSRLP